jgi:hypothetical protein
MKTIHEVNRHSVIGSERYRPSNVDSPGGNCEVLLEKPPLILEIGSLTWVFNSYL